MLVADLGSELVEQRGGNLDHVTATLAHEMVVGLVRQVEHCTARPQLDSFDDAKLDEHVERSVHRALVELGVVGAHGGDDVGGREVVSWPAGEGVDDQATWPGHPPTAAPQALDDVLGSQHDHEATERRTVANRSLMQVVRIKELVAVRLPRCA